MAKHKKEIVVQFPDCGVCGRDIGMEEFLELEIHVWKEQYDTEGDTPLSHRDISSLSICERCISHPEIWKQKLYAVVDEMRNRQHH